MESWSGVVESWPGVAVYTVPGVAVCINAPNITNDGPVHFPIDGLSRKPHSGSCQRGDAGTVDRGKPGALSKLNTRDAT